MVHLDVRGVFTFTLISSYKMAVETNELYHLADIENATIKNFSINSFQHNYLTKQNPIIGALWSLIMPSLGAVWTHRVITAVFELIWWIVILLKSHLLAGIEYTALGNFSKATSVLDPEWLLFVPSIYSFLFYYTYTKAVEMNKLFEKEQVNFLHKQYQLNPKFQLRIKDDERKMRFIASFDCSIYLEKALATLESVGIPKNDMFAAPLDKRNKRSVWFDTMHHSDGKALMDGIALLGGLGCVLGTIYGFVLTWGPVLWGLIGFIGGGLVGCIIKILFFFIKSRKREYVSLTEVFVIVDCEDDLEKTVEYILWSNHAFGISKLGHNLD